MAHSGAVDRMLSLTTVRVRILVGVFEKVVNDFGYRDCFRQVQGFHPPLTTEVITDPYSYDPYTLGNILSPVYSLFILRPVTKHYQRVPR